MPSSHPVKVSNRTQVHLLRAVKRVCSTPWISMQEIHLQGVRWSRSSGGVLLLPARLETVTEFLAKGLGADRPMAVM